MKAILDKFGRIVIPKKLRHSLGLKPGAALHIEAVNSEIHLTPVIGTPDVRSKNGWLVFSGILSDDVSDAIDDVRNQRIETLTGPAE